MANKFPAKPGLTPKEVEHLGNAIPYVEQYIKDYNRFPGKRELKSFLHCGDELAQHIRKHIIANRLVSMPPSVAMDANAELKEEDVVKEDTRTISLPKTRIHTLEQLIQAFEIDLEVWEVERFVANKWEMGYKDANSNPGSYELYQVKAFLRRKRFTSLEHYAKDNARLRSQVEKLRLEVKSERELAKLLARNHAGYDDLLASIKEVMDQLGDFQLPVYEIPQVQAPLVIPAVSGGHSEDAVLLLSDTHYGDRIRREDTSGFPEFDLVIAGNRTGYVVQKVKQILTLHRAMYPIKRLYIWMGGDIGNGVLHDSPNSNELFPPAQVHFSYNMIKFVIEELLQLTVPDAMTGTRVIEEIVLLFTVGNHMRLDEKMPHKYQGQRTLDWLIYQFLIERFKGHPNVTVRSETSPFIFENIRGHRYLFAHGMQVGYKNNPDTQSKAVGNFLSLVRGLFDSPEWRRKNGLMGETFSRVCIGDIHVPLSFPRFKSNGSLNGQNELGVNWTLEPIPAGMQLFGVSNKHQETWGYFIECTSVQREKADMNAYGKFAEDYAKRVGR